MLEDEPKSAVEIAMEKLRARDDYRENPLSDEQKSKIAEIRSASAAKIAELEITHQSIVKQVSTYEELEKLQEELVREKKRISQKMEKRIEAIHNE